MAHRRTETACFGVVTKKIRNIFRHFPKSKSWSEGLQLFPTPNRELLRKKDYTFPQLLDCQSLIQLEQSDDTKSLIETPSHVNVLNLHQKQNTDDKDVEESISDDGMGLLELSATILGPQERKRLGGRKYKLFLEDTEATDLEESISGDGMVGLLELSATLWRPKERKRLSGRKTKFGVDAPKEEKKTTTQELKQKIENFNKMVQNGLIMKMADDGTYTGFIKVYLNLRRPVTVTGGSQSLSNTMKEVLPNKVAENKTSFFLPLDAVKQLHISSVTTASEVIRGLLQKFQVLDDPQKFALFKQMKRDGQVHFQKLALTEHPLYLRLLAGPETDLLNFVMKENDTGDVQWEAFTVPELQNFLLILDKEEREKVHQVHTKYDTFRQHLQNVLTEATRKPV
ncbi:ras association domain-containing 5 [Pelobates cultripes]|uniref:Ras association domain-containing 5 n=1 Tax=Pelobates cultripes TaxID=61616 RepID=A0AAD1R103_PELCU|nr:ras association domain-containing 5 [Pelobates cultripes]